MMSDQKYFGEKTILIVEDSLTQLEQLRFILEDNDYRVLAARDGQQALAIIESEIPNLIISDIIMPNMDGYELCSLVKSNSKYKKIPVMLLTNLSDPHDVIKGLQAGADNFLTKPYNESFLLQRIKFILINQEMRQNSLSSDMGIEIVFGGEKYFINSDRMQIIDLLLSTYENAIQKNGELSEANQKLIALHRELEKKNKELEKLNEDKNNFLRMAAHDLRNPIGAILSFSALLIDDLQGKLNDEEAEYLGIIKSSSEFLLSLLNELLDLAVIESGKLILNLRKVNLVDIARANLGVNKVLGDNKQISVELEVNSDEIIVNVDSVKIEQVLNNLISNAIKFSHPNSSVKIKIRKEDNSAILSVEDQGQGIPEKDFEKLFKPFAKTSVLSTAGEKSTGLGLSIVKKIVESHNGTIWFESKKDVGSTFFVKLPLA